MIFGKYINKYYLKYAWLFIIGLFALVVVDYFQLLIPEYLRMLINGVNTGLVEVGGAQKAFDVDVLLKNICMPMLVVIAMIMLGRFGWRMCFFGAGIKTEARLRRKMFDSARYLSPRFYHENKVGSLMALFTNDLDTIQECFGWGVMMFFDATILGGMAIIKMWRMNLSLTLLCMLPMLFLLIVSAIVGHFEMVKWEKRQAAFSELTDFTQESFSGISVIKAFVKELKQLNAFKKICAKNEATNVSYTKIMAALHVFITLFVESVVCIILGYGGYCVWRGQLNAGQLLEFVGYFNSVIWPIMAVSQLIDMHSRGKASLNRIGRLLDARPDVIDRADVLKIDKIKGAISIENLTFRYPDAKIDALRDITIDISAGERIGIIGRTGAGKTTLISLIMRAYNCGDGMIKIDGNEINRVPLKTLRESVAYVPQDNFLFSDTIKSNIAFSVDDGAAVVDEKVREAAAYALVADDVEGFSSGYDTKLGERGITVSGGQKQRLSIARAFMKDAPVLIMDDSLSAVDADTEKKILANLTELRTGKTTILIAHRVSAMEKTDKVLFMENGSIKAMGSHDKLVESCPEYARLVELQRLSDKEREND